MAFDLFYPLYYSKVDMKQGWQNENTEALIGALLSLKTRDRARRFLRDLLTEAEIMEFGSRWRAANLLDKKVSYLEIANQTGLSSRTIARISRWLKKGMGGYRTMIGRTHQHAHISSSVGSGMR